MAPHLLPLNINNDDTFSLHHHHHHHHNHNHNYHHNGDTYNYTMEDGVTTPRRKNNAGGGWIVQKFGGTSVGKFPEQISNIAGYALYFATRIAC